MPAGRPTDYKPEYCKEIVEFMADGRHVIEFAAHVDVAKATVYRWADEHEEFRDALKRAGTKSTAAWLRMHRDKASGVKKEGSDILIIQMLKNKDREFCENQVIDASMKHETGSVDLSKLSEDQLLAIKNAIRNE